MAMKEQERRSLPLETARTASNEPRLPGLGPATGRSAAAMATGAMVGGGAGVEGERGPAEGDPDNVRSTSPWAALLSVVGYEFQRRPRSNVPRAAPSLPWGSKLLPVLPPAPAKKKAKKKSKKHRPGKCAICEKTETPLWRTMPTDQRVMLCNACGIRARAPGAVLPKLLHPLRPAPATETLTATTVVSEQEEPPAQKIQGLESPPDSPISDSESDSTMQDPGVYLLKRRSPMRENLPPPPPPPESAPDNKADKEVTKSCQHCGNRSSLQWRKGPMGPSTLCNPCGVRFRQSRLVPEYRPRASPTFNQSEHSHRHREVLQLRAMQEDHPAPPPAFQPCGTRKRRKGKEHEQQRQVRKKRKGSKEHNDQQPAAQPAAMAALQVRKKSNKGTLSPKPALLKLRKELKGKEQKPVATQPRAGDDMVRQQHLPPPPPPALLPHAGDDMVRQEKLPPPPPAQPHTGYVMAPYLDLPPALLHAYEMKMEQNPLSFPPVPPGFEHLVVQPTPAKNTLAPPRAGDELAPQYLVPTPAPELPHAADGMEMEHNLLPFPPVPPGFEHLVVQPTPPAAKKKVTTKKAKKQARLPEQVHLPAPTTATTVVSEEQAPSQEIHDSESPPDSPILESMLHLNVYLLKRTSPRRDKSPPPPPTVAESSAPAPAPDKKGKRVKCCVHCGATWRLQWRSGPAGPSTLCNACGLRHRDNRLVPEYRPRASPTFNPAEHSYKHREVLQFRAMKDHPAPPAPFQPSRNRRRRKGTELQHQPAQVGKKRKGTKEHNDQPAQPAVAVLQVHKKSKGTKEQNDQPAQPAAVVLQVHKKNNGTKEQNNQPAQPAAVHKKSKGKAQRLPPEPALLKLHKKHKGKEQRRGAPQPVDAGDDMVQQQHHLPPLPPVPLPRAGNVMVRQQLLPPPPPAQPHAGYDMVRCLPLPPALLHAGDHMEMEQHQLLLPPALPHAGDEMVQQHLPATPPELPHASVDMEQHLLPPPPAQPHAVDDELMMGVPIPPLDPFLFDEPAAPRIINDDKPVTVIVIDDD